jgi:hypothetical protein
MCLAHIAQVPVEDSPTIIAKLLNHKDWDVIRILRDTERIANKGLTKGEIIGAGVVVVVGAVILLHSLKVLSRRLR